jgi:tetratricopeptide (TPR) repeat protein
VFNNIGACWFNLALKRLYEIDRKVYHRFRISAAVDYDTSAEGVLQFRGDEVYLKDKLFSRYIDKAEKYFRTAVEKDSQNITSRCNLSAALLLKGQYARVQAECDVLLKKDPKDVQALNNKAIAFYYYGQKEDLDTTLKAIELLHRANRIDPGNFEVLYNLASLKEMRERWAGAKFYWEKYLKIAPKDNYYSHIYQKMKGKPLPEAVTKKSADIPRLEEDVRIGEAIAKIERKWNKGKTRKYEMGNEEIGEKGNKNKGYEGWSVNIHVIAAKNVRVLGLDGMVEMVERKIESPMEVSILLERLGKPGAIVRHPSGNFYLYKNKGFSFKEVNGKVQSYIWFEKNF